MSLFLLFESASGFAIFERVKSEEIGIELNEVQKAITDLAKFSKIMKLKAFLPFQSAESALEAINALSESEITKGLADFVEMNVPADKKGKIQLGVIDPKIGNIFSETLGIKCVHNELILELMRGIRLHFVRFIKGLKEGDLHQAQLGLCHSFSRSKVKFNVHKVDNMIIQSISLLDQLDKDLNTFAMRVREWYGWHFPELVRVVNDNYQYCRVALAIKDRKNLSDALLPELEEITSSPETAKAILEASKMSMGTTISEMDMLNVQMFAKRVASLQDYRLSLHKYLSNKMHTCAPNLSALIGEQVGARLISHAGSLTNLAKYPASTVQILGAEKALFRALKTKGNTPKYGLIFHSSFISKAGPKNKGRISRYLANKCSIASRIDCFSDDSQSSDMFGQEMKKQVEERLEFYKSGTAPRKNLDVMRKVISEEGEAKQASATSDKKEKKEKKEKKDKKRALEETMDVDAPVVAEEEEEEKPRKVKKHRVAA